MKNTLLYLHALAIFAGTIIGVGIFGLPYVTSKAGFGIVAFFFILMVAAVIAANLLFAKVVVSTPEIHRFPGYIGEYLGPVWKKITFVSFVIGLTGALLAYLIVGGEFLASYFSQYFGGSPMLYTLIFFSTGTYFILRGVKSIARIELVLLCVFFVLIGLFFGKALPHISADNFLNNNLLFFSLPYGVILFSLWGSAVIPEVKEMVKGSWPLIRLVIVSGVILAAFTYLWFIVTIFGVTGSATTTEGLSGFTDTLGNGVVTLGFLFGVITTFTSFLMLGLTLKKTFWYDMGIPKNVSGLLAVGIPLGLFFVGLRQFIDIIGAVGAFTIGLEGTLIVFLYRTFLKKQNKKMNPLLYSLVFLFIMGVVFEMYYLFIR